MLFITGTFNPNINMFTLVISQERISIIKILQKKHLF